MASKSAMRAVAQINAAPRTDKPQHPNTAELIDFGFGTRARSRARAD